MHTVWLNQGVGKISLASNLQLILKIKLQMIQSRWRPKWVVFIFFQISDFLKPYPLVPETQKAGGVEKVLFWPDKMIFFMIFFMPHNVINNFLPMNISLQAIWYISYLCLPNTIQTIKKLDLKFKYTLTINSVNKVIQHFYRQILLLCTFIGILSILSSQLKCSHSSKLYIHWVKMLTSSLVHTPMWPSLTSSIEIRLLFLK